VIRVGFDAKRFFWNFTGLGNHSRSLVRGLAHHESSRVELKLFTPKINSAVLADDPMRDRYQIVSPKHRFARLAWREWRVVDAIRERDLHVYHGLSAELPIGVEKLGVLPVVTIHDLVAETRPELFGAVDARIYRWKMRSAVKRAGLVLATSEATKQEVLEVYRKSPEQVHVLYQPPAEGFLRAPDSAQDLQTRARLGLPREYLLSVGSVIERKRLRATLRALAHPRLRALAPRLVVVGSLRSDYAKLAQQDVRELGLESQVIWLSDLSARDLPAVTRGALVSVYPSIYEGFGIPLAEAMVSRVPVLTSKFSCLPEVVGPGGICVNPDDVEEFAEALAGLLEDQVLRGHLASQGYAHAASRYLPAPLAARLVDLYHSFLN